MTEPEHHGEPHQCFGCGQPIKAMAPHIHLPLDEWAVKKGLEPIGMDDLLTFPFCEPCTEPTDDGWQPHAHEGVA